MCFEEIVSGCWSPQRWVTICSYNPFFTRWWRAAGACSVNAGYLAVCPFPHRPPPPYSFEGEEGEEGEEDEEGAAPGGEGQAPPGQQPPECKQQ